MKKELHKLRKALRKPIEYSSEEISKGLIHTIAKKKVYSLLDAKNKGSKKLHHIAHFTLSNAGDILLPVLVRDMFRLQDNQVYWRKQHVHQDVDDKSVSKINGGKGLVIGGGGLFIKDTNRNNKSGWQWSCSADRIKEIDVPMALYSVGYNRFRGQGDFDEVFYDHVIKVTEKAEYIGLRNYGSIKSFKAYIPEELHHKIRFQPCLTTVISKMYPDQFDWNKTHKPSIAINCAFDRSKNRYGETIGQKLDEVAAAIKVLSEKYTIKYFVHTETDKYFLPFLEGHNVPYELELLNFVTPQKIIEAYKSTSLVIGMRGHAQLIPFGCRTPILSLVSHNKLKFFLDDLGKENWHVDINDPTLKDSLIEKSRNLLATQDEIVSFIDQKQDELYKISLANTDDFLKVI